MWTRKELKQRAKEALIRNYWKIVLVTFLSVLVGSGSLITVLVENARTVYEDRVEIVKPEVVENMELSSFENVSTTEDNAICNGVNSSKSDLTSFPNFLYAELQKMSDTDKVILAVIIFFALMTALSMIAFVYALIALLYNPFYMGVCRFMLKSVYEKAEMKEIVYGFDHSYKNVVKTMFHVDLRVFLWTFLFIIPGIYKEYQYRMVPYILAECPNMDYKEALRRSSNIMNGEKWHTFVLDLSFIPWRMLGIITGGIAGLFYVNSYIYLTNAALYRKLCEH